MIRRYFVSLAIMLAVIGSASTPTIHLRSVPRCEEDMPCWDCETMGNGICGLTPSEDAAERAESTMDNGQR